MTHVYVVCQTNGSNYAILGIYNNLDLARNYAQELYHDLAGYTRIYVNKVPIEAVINQPLDDPDTIIYDEGQSIYTIDGPTWDVD